MRLSIDERSFTGRLHDERVTVRIGVALGVAIAVCFVTGVISHLIQHPPTWFAWPTRPVDLYRWTQGLHVLSGTAAVPLVLAKLYTVYPRLFTRPAVRSVGHALERGSVLVLVGAVLFELVTGLLNIAHWYPWPFFFPPAHFAVAFLAAGAVLLHVAVKLPVIRRAFLVPLESDAAPSPEPSRRAFLGAVAAATAAVVLATAGSTVPWLRRISVLAVRTGDGPQGVPVNKTAAAAGVAAAATSPDYRLTVTGPSGRLTLSLAELHALPQHTCDLPIACVEGWSATGRWSGVRVADLVAMAGGTPASDVAVVSLQRGGAYSRSLLPAAHAHDPLTLLALGLSGQPLDLDHGYPCRVIAPSRPGVLQTKWVQRLEVSA